MKPNVSTALALLLAVVLAIWGMTERDRRIEAETKLAGRENSAAVARAAIAEAPQDRRYDPNTGENRGSIRERSGEKKPEAEAEKNPMAGMAEAMNTPEMRDAFRAQARASIGMLYGELFDLLELDEPTRANVMQILGDRQEAIMDASMAFWQGRKPTAEDTAKMREAVEKSEADLKALLGEESYGKLAKYEDSQPERQQLQALAAQGLRLDEEAEARLMDAMYEERKNQAFEHDFARPERVDYADLTPEAIDRHAEQSSALRARVLERARGILTPEQLPVFERGQQQQAAMEKFGLDMTRNWLRQAAEK